MQLDLTIAVCTHNSAPRLHAALEAIAAMIVPQTITWECLIIDNASTDGTAEAAGQIGRRLNLPLRIVREPELGFVQTRKRVAKEARSEIVAFVDDDNLVEPDFAQNSVRFLREHPLAASVGAKIVAEFEDPKSVPADFAERFADALAIRDFGPVPRQLLGPAEDPPCSAGMAIRTELLRQVMLDYGLQVKGRGEDMEIGLVLRRVGWETWYSPDLKLRHVLPARGLTQEYLDELIITGAAANTWLDYLRGKEPERSRLGYHCLWLKWRLLATRMKLVKWFKGSNHRHAKRFPFWIRLYESRATGYLGMADNDRVLRLDASMNRHVVKRTESK